MLDLTDPKIAVVHDTLMNVLGARNVEKISDYFTEDATLIINETIFKGPEIAERIEWLKNNNDIKSIKIAVLNVFFSGDQGFDHHTTEVIYKNNSKATYKIFGYTQLRNNKICHYEDVTIQLAGEKNMTPVTAS